MKRNYALFVFFAIISAALLAGCVSKASYDRDIGRLTAELQAERANSALTIKTLENKIQERGKSLNMLTDRYIVLQKSSISSQEKLNSLKGSLDALSSDMEELKLVIHANVRGSAGNEMLIKLVEMQRKIKDLLGKAEKLTPASDEE